MTELDFIRAIGIMIVTAALLVLVARVVRMPSIVAYILAGLVLGPLLGMLVFEVHGAGESDAPRAMEVVTELGIALLLFLVGLELSFDRIRGVGKVSILAGVAQVTFITVVGFLLCILLQFSVMASIFIAVALTNSSTVLVVKLLDQKRETNETYGHIIVALNLVKDVLLIVILTLLAGLGAAEGLAISEVAITLTLAGVGIVVLLAASILCAKFVLPRPFAWAAPVPQTLFIWSLTWCFLFAAAAEWLGLSAAIGAFLAGISLAQLEVSNDLRRRVHPLMNFFLAIFFISIGAQMEIGAAISLWPSFVVLTLFVLIGIPIFTMWVTARLGYGKRTSFLTGLSMGQISELSFIFAAVGLTYNLIDDVIGSLITLLGLVTIGISSYLILYNGQVYDFMRRVGLIRWLKAPDIAESAHAELPLSNHVIVVGMNALGRRLATELHRRGETVLAIDTDVRKLAGLKCRTMVGHVDYLSVVEEAGLPDAKLGITALQIEDTNNLFVYRCKQFGVPVAAHAFDRSVVDDLKRLGTDFLIDAKTEASRLLHERLEEAGVVSPAQT